MLAGFSPGRRCSLKRSLKKLFGHENRVNSLTWPAFMLIYRTKESFYIRKEFNSHRVFLVHQLSRRFIVLEHQYGHGDVM